MAVHPWQTFGSSAWEAGWMRIKTYTQQWRTSVETITENDFDAWYAFRFISPVSLCLSVCVCVCVRVPTCESFRLSICLHHSLSNSVYGFLHVQCAFDLCTFTCFLINLSVFFVSIYVCVYVLQALHVDLCIVC